MAETDIPSRSVSRRAVLARMVAAGLTLGPAAPIVAACGMRDERRGPEASEAPDRMVDDGMMDRQMMADMRVIRDLLAHHQDIQREVEDIERGIRAETISEDPKLAELIRTHV